MSFFWNIRGLNQTSKQLVIRQWISSFNLQFGCILETRVFEDRAISISSNICPGWNFMNNYQDHRLGRIWILWSNEVRLTPVFCSAQLMTCAVMIPGQAAEFFCSFVYASNFRKDRKELWNDLCSHHDSGLFTNQPWIIMGDFNETISLDDYHGDSKVGITNSMREFQEVFNHCSLIDLPSLGPTLTWWNKRKEGKVYKRLDRVMVNSSWCSLFRNSSSIFDAGGVSDHLRCRIVLKETSQDKRKIPFKFVNALTKSDKLMDVVSSYWSTTSPLYISTSALFRFMRKLKALKPILRNLSKELIGDITKRTKEAYDTLCCAQQENMSSLSDDSISKELEAFKRWQHLSTIEEQFLSQRAKVHWLKVGDGNNKYFYNSIIQRHIKNNISEIHQGGITFTAKGEIQAAAVSFFDSFFNEQSNIEVMSTEVLQKLVPFRCSEAQQNSLTKAVSEDEVTSILFSLPNNKSPGPDGFSSEFYKATWPLLKKDFLIAIRSFFITGFLPKSVNATILALVPKKENVKEMKDYRPISCCNVLYKVISKLLANRLKSMLPSMISHNQSAFVKNRLLMENVLMATEIVKDYHLTSTSPRCALQIDISKAFDSVDWNFLFQLLDCMAFPPQFVHWVKVCVTTASFSVQVNGELAGHFGSSRGLRQGCSLSPFLFVICINVLSLLIDESARLKLIDYHPKCADLGLTHLCFADDVMAFVEGNYKSIEGIVNVFNNFARFSGLKISLEKTTMFLAGVRDDVSDQVQANFGIKKGNLPVRYLGLPLMSRSFTKADLLPLTEKISKRINSWKARALSYAGRIQLIKSVISGLTNFWLSAFRIPKGIIQEIESLCSAFLWSGTDMNCHKAKVAWVDVTKPKREGGLGIRSLVDVNKVSCLKLIWRIVSHQNSLWVSWIWRYLIRENSFWSLSDTTSCGSWMWKKLLKYRCIARRFCKVEVISGSSTSFWHDAWSSLGIIFDLVGERGFIDMGISQHQSVQSVIITHRRRRHRRNIFNQLEDELDNLKLKIVDGPDRFLWRSEGDNFTDKFSTKNTWNIVRCQSPSVPWYNTVWFSHHTPKFSFICWLAILNRLDVGYRIKQWNSEYDSTCLLCSQEEETRDHLFFSCLFSSSVWHSLMKNFMGSSYSEEWTSLSALCSMSLGSPTKTFLIRYTFQVTIYHLWRERNERKHNSKKCPANLLVKYIDKAIRNRLTSLRELGVTSYADGYQI